LPCSNSSTASSASWLNKSCDSAKKVLPPSFGCKFFKQPFGKNILLFFRQLRSLCKCLFKKMRNIWSSFYSSMIFNSYLPSPKVVFFPTYTHSPSRIKGQKQIAAGDFPCSVPQHLIRILINRYQRPVGPYIFSRGKRKPAFSPSQSCLAHLYKSKDEIRQIFRGIAHENPKAPRSAEPLYEGRCRGSSARMFRRNTEKEKGDNI